MGRCVRRVPANWEHPLQEDGKPVPLRDGYTDRLSRWDAECASWCEGQRPDYADAKARALPSTALAYALWAGDQPTPGTHMPDWPKEERTHFQMYEDTSEGTPMSPVMETPKALATWLADNGASWFGDTTADCEQWFIICATYTFTCDQCRRMFGSEWTEEEANAQARDRFGGENASTTSGMAEVCSGCYAKMGFTP